MSASKLFDPEDAARRGYTRADWDAVDSPELSNKEIAGLRPMAEMRPDLFLELSEPSEAEEKTAVALSLDSDLVLKLRSFGPGWEGHVNEALRRWIEKAA